MIINLKKYNINKFSGKFSDSFYSPKKYLTYELFNLFELFSNYNVFLEIDILSIINNIEPCKSNYQVLSSKILWRPDRKNFKNKEYIYDSLNKYFILHPIKFNETPESKEWLKDIFL